MKGGIYVLGFCF